MWCQDVLPLSITLNLSFLMYGICRRTIEAILNYRDKQRLAHSTGQTAFYKGEQTKLDAFKREGRVEQMVREASNIRVSTVFANSITNTLLSAIVFSLGMRVLLAGHVMRDPLFAFDQATQDALQLLLAFGLLNIALNVGRTTSVTRPWMDEKHGIEILVQHAVSSLVLLVLLYTRQAPVLVLILCVMASDQLAAEALRVYRTRHSNDAFPLADDADDTSYVLLGRWHKLVLRTRVASVCVFRIAAPNALLAIGAYQARHQFFQVSRLTLSCFCFTVMFFFIFNIWFLKKIASGYHRHMDAIRTAQVQRRDRDIIRGQVAAVSSAYVTRSHVTDHVTRDHVTESARTSCTDVTCNIDDVSNGQQYCRKNNTAALRMTAAMTSFNKGDNNNKGDDNNKGDNSCNNKGDAAFDDIDDAEETHVFIGELEFKAASQPF